MIQTNRIICGDALEVLKTFPGECVQMVMTSPPYYALRDYGIPGQLGLEETPGEYIRKMVEIFREIKRVLRDDGVVFLNMGDSYSVGTNDPKSFRRDRAAVNPARRRAPSCDISDKAPPDCPLRDSIWNHPCDECQAASVLRNLRNGRPASSELNDGSRDPIQERKESPNGHFPTSDSSSPKRPPQFSDAIQDQPPSSIPTSASHPEVGESKRQTSSPALPQNDANQAPSSAAPLGYSTSLPDAQKSVRRVSRKNNRKESVSSSASHKKDTDHNACPYHNYTIPFPKVKPKDLMGMPWRVAFALQADGWYLRSDIIWSKPNPMPESVTDRPTKAHEYLFLLSKSAKYYYDADAIREEQTGNAHSRGKGLTPKGEMALSQNHRANNSFFKNTTAVDIGGRNARTVWTIPTQPYPEAHFATFPEELCRRPILAGTSEKGCCPECGAPWGREVEKETHFEGGSGKAGRSASDANASGKWAGKQYGENIKLGPVVETRTVGWQPTCSCGIAETVPCIVLDPFAGSGTTCLVANNLGRRWVGIELNPEYVKLANKRLRQKCIWET